MQFRPNRACMFPGIWEVAWKAKLGRPESRHRKSTMAVLFLGLLLFEGKGVIYLLCTARSLVEGEEIITHKPAPLPPSAADACVGLAPWWSTQKEHPTSGY